MITPSKIKKAIVVVLSLISLGMVGLIILSFTVDTDNGFTQTETGTTMLCCAGPVLLFILLVSAWLMSSANKDELVERQLERERGVKK